MYLDKNRLRRVLAAAALTTSAGLSLAAGVVRAEMTATSDPGQLRLAAGSHAAEAPPGSARDSGARPAGRQIDLVDRYEVASGDSFWAIAEQQLPDDASVGDVAKLTKRLIDDNAPRLGYADPAMIKPGDVVSVAAASRPAAPAAPAANRAPAPASHEVAAGDSYWAIAETVVGADAAPSEVQAKTEELMSLNSGRLGYDDPRMIHPGDVVYLEIVREDARPLIDAAERAVSAKPTIAKPAPTSLIKPTDAARAWWPRWETPWSSPLVRTAPAQRAQVPTSPPLSELAIIATSDRQPRPAAQAPAVTLASASPY